MENVATLTSAEITRIGEGKSENDADFASHEMANNSVVKHEKSYEEVLDNDANHPIEPRFDEETMISCFLESILPLTLAGCGQLLTGLYLDYLQYSMFFVRISPAMILVTPLLNLKGNLEMNFASRIATYCHIGMVRSNRDLMQLGCINHGLSQSQTITASFVIAVVCIVIKYPVPLNDAVIFLASAITTASVASFTIETFLLFVVIIARLLHANPDNVATPIAATVGDISTLFFYVWSGYIYIYFCPTGFCYLSLVAIVASAVLIPFYIRLTSSHPSTKRALISGWLPLILAATISSGGGIILASVHMKHPAFALLQPVLVGLVGNMCGIQASRISSQLHVYHRKGELEFGVFPRQTLFDTLNPIPTFFSEGIHSKVALMMILVAMPTQLIFAILCLFIAGRPSVVGVDFCIAYLLCIFALITIFMYFCQLFVHLLWRFHHDPDYSVIPLLTALCDFIGSFFLLLVFEAINRITDEKEHWTTLTERGSNWSSSTAETVTIARRIPRL